MVGFVEGVINLQPFMLSDIC